MIPVPMNWKAIIPAIIILFTLLPSSGLLAERSPRTLPAEVLWITGGGTIVIRLQGYKEKVRLIGIDAPECRPNPKAEKDVIRTGAYLRTINEMGRERPGMLNRFSGLVIMLTSNWMGRNGTGMEDSWDMSGSRMAVCSMKKSSGPDLLG